MRLHNGPQVLFTVQMLLKSLCIECNSKQRLQAWEIEGIPEHRQTVDQTSSQEVYVDTPIGLRQVYGRRREVWPWYNYVFRILPWTISICIPSPLSTASFELSVLFNLFISSSLFLWFSSRPGQDSSVSCMWGQDRIVWPEASRVCLRNLDPPGGWGRVLYHRCEGYTIYRSGQE